MKIRTDACLFVFIILVTVFTAVTVAQTQYYDQTRDGFLVFHPIKTDTQGKIISWASMEPGQAFDFVINAVWSFWDTMRTDMNGLPYYMNHQVWRPGINDRRGIGGDQLAMALSAWRLLYQYSGNEKVKENMKFITDYYLSHSLSPADAVWPNIPFPYNCLIYSGRYDGDMVIGQGYTQPDKAGAFGDELVDLFKMTGNHGYINAAIKIAHTLAKHTELGDNDFSPLPFKVNALTGEVGVLKRNYGDHDVTGLSSYTTNWVGALKLFEKLIDLNLGEVEQYEQARSIILDWMQEFPLQTNKWGPFFEDIPGWSDTQINAVTFARYIMENKASFPDWEKQVAGIFAWVYENLGNKDWEKYGVVVVNEQTAYQTPGNSHSSRQAAAELMYDALSGKNHYTENAIRQLLWATYMVDNDGKNCYPRDEVWLTDGYGDYVRHFLRAMAVKPELAPANANHILHSTSVISQADYAPNFNKTLAQDIHGVDISKALIFYRTFDNSGTETLRLTAKPARVLLNYKPAPELPEPSGQGWSWRPLDNGGVLTVIRGDANNVIVAK